MFTDDHPLHSEDVQRAAGPPAAAVDELLPSTGLGQSPLLTSLGMNYYLSYNAPPPCFTWWPPLATLNPNNYPHPTQQIYRGGISLWPPPPPHVPLYNYYCSPVMKPLPTHSAWQTQPLYVQNNQLNDLPPPVNPVKGTKQIKNAVPKSQRLPRKNSLSVYEEKGVDKTFPPDIYDETVFPSLTRKIELLESAVNVPIEVSSNRRPCSLTEIKSKKDIQNPTANTKSMFNSDKIDEPQNKNQILDLGREDVFKENFLEMVIERKHQLKENAEANRKSVTSIKYKDWLINNPHLVEDYQGQSLWMIPRSSWAVANMVPTHPLELSWDNSQLYRYILRYIPSRKRLKDFGYPIISLDAPNKVEITKQEGRTAYTNNNNKRENVSPPRKLCDRCGAIFVMKTGKAIHKDDCVYHWGKMINTDEFEVLLTCCKRPPSSHGCTTAKSHVWNGLYCGTNRGLMGFLRTEFVTSRAVRPSNIFGLDCEMCFTTEGLELVKVALVDLLGNQVYYSLVYPENEVVDYNTRFSGVSERDLMNSEAKSFRQVQEEVLNLIQTTTIIIGHGLENDLRALKIVHNLVVDTSIVYPHHHGFPSRRTLKDIAEEVLGRKIQEGGHNPVEDANVCVELILKQLKMDFNIQIKPNLRMGLASQL